MASTHNKGFTLIEVMVALVIVGLSLTAVAASMSQMIEASRAMRDRTYASWIAQNRIAELRLAAATPDVGSSDGEVQYANTDWSWRATISETGVDELYRIDVAVAFAGSEDTIRTVTGFMGLPTTSGEANRIWIRGSAADAPAPEAGATE
jgi:general secretion pathway protein I